MRGHMNVIYAQDTDKDSPYHRYRSPYTLYHFCMKKPWWEKHWKKLT